MTATQAMQNYQRKIFEQNLSKYHITPNIHDLTERLKKHENELILLNTIKIKSKYNGENSISSHFSIREGGIITKPYIIVDDHSLDYSIEIVASHKFKLDDEYYQSSREISMINYEERKIRISEKYFERKSPNIKDIVDGIEIENFTDVNLFIGDEAVKKFIFMNYQNKPHLYEILKNNPISKINIS